MIQQLHPASPLYAACLLDDYMLLHLIPLPAAVCEAQGLQQV